MSSNGRLTAAELSPIPGGQLENSAAAAWNAKGGPADAGLRPLGAQSSYRDYAGQLYFWSLWQSGRGNLAAYPGTSNHGWGKAVDLAATWMRSWIDSNGRRFGWAKVEAFSEWWHVNYIGGGLAALPRFKAIRKGMKGPRVKAVQRLLRHTGGVHGHPYKFWHRGVPFSGRFGRYTRRMVRKFQRTHGLKDDGVVGEKTWHKLRELGKHKAHPKQVKKHNRRRRRKHRGKHKQH